MFLLCFYGPVLYKWPLNWRWQIIAMCAHGAQEEKTCLHLVSSSFERWTLSVDLQCVFHSGSRHIQIRCNFLSLVPSVQQIDVSGNDIGGEGVLQGVRLPNCVLKICTYIFTEDALQGVIFQEFCHLNFKQHGLCQIFYGQLQGVHFFGTLCTSKMKIIFILILMQFCFWCIRHLYKSNWIWKQFPF